MTVTILVATPHAPFGELLRMSLEDSGSYRVRLVHSAHEARKAAGHITFQLAILDSALTDEPFVPLCKDLLNNQAGLRLVVIPPENNPNHPSLADLLPHDYLSRPFYLPDLLNTVSRLLNERKSELRQIGDLPAAAAFSVTLPPWLQEPLTLTNYLEKELAGTQALAGIIGAVGVQPSQSQLRAYAGQLSDDAAKELAGVVFRYWKCDEKTDLMRFIRLTSDKRDYLVYATPIVGDLVLILAYDTAAPLSLIRPQTKGIAQTLAGMPPEGYHQAHAAQPPQTDSAPGASGPEAPATPAPEAERRPEAKAAPTEPAASAPAPVQDAGKPDLPAVNDEAQAPAASAPSQETSQTQPLDDAFFGGRSHSGFYPVEPPDPFEEEPGPELDVINLAALLGSIPSPDPEAPSPGNNGWKSQRSAAREIPTLPGGMNEWEHIEGPEAPGQAPEAVNLPEAEILPVANDLPVAEEPPVMNELPAAGKQPETVEPSDANHQPVAKDLQAAEVLPEAVNLPEAIDQPEIEEERPISDEEFLAVLQRPVNTGPLGQVSASKPAQDEPGAQELPPQEAAEEEPLLPRGKGTGQLQSPADPGEAASADWAYAWDEPAAPAAADKSPEAEARPQQPDQPLPGVPSVWMAESPAWPNEDTAHINTTGKPSGPPAEGSLIEPAPGLDLSIEPAPDPLEDTRPRVIATITQLNQLEPVSPALSLLNYTCVLVPRLPNHYLIGDLADKVSAWVAQICLAFGWRLEGIAVRPEYLQWSVQVAPAVSPGNLVRILRQRTSLHIFSAFPQFAAQNPSGDFWATGYLIVSGPQPPSAQLLRDYIVQTRRRQGIGK